ncbi:MAG: hypothetical protein IPM45_12285 [Acidimicrobiales bacterium]|nr:hypothetical protein [Acidimicrobiales bacterium]
MSPPARIAAYTPDLMDRSRVEAAAAGDVRFVGSPGELVEAARHAEVVVADLSRDGVLDALRAIDGHCFDVRVIAYGSHVERAALAAARAAGCDQVLARSELFAGLPELLAPPGE